MHEAEIQLASAVYCAESKEKLTSAYLKMAKMLGIYIDHQQVERTIQAVRARLAGLPCFYVFDNAPDARTIEAFLPLKTSTVAPQVRR